MNGRQRRRQRERRAQVGGDGGAGERESGRTLGRTDDTEHTLTSTQWLHCSLHSHLLHCWHATQKVPRQPTQLVGVKLAAAERGVLEGWMTEHLYTHTPFVCAHTMHTHTTCMHMCLDPGTHQASFNEVHVDRSVVWCGVVWCGEKVWVWLTITHRVFS